MPERDSRRSCPAGIRVKGVDLCGGTDRCPHLWVDEMESSRVGRGLQLGPLSNKAFFKTSFKYLLSIAVCQVL